MKKLEVDIKHRKFLIKSLTTDLLKKGSVVTTVAKAKELKRNIDIVINLAKRQEKVGHLHAKRMVLAKLTSETVTTNLFKNLDVYNSRNSGYSTSAILGFRRGDNARMCIVKLIDKKAS